ncbi:MAG: hypothetical protein EOP24_19770 [Hyphomicrobiales bacterium]|nr:MAG: hypothetical protein EOP24_19770 [Hyphomicrobiales bacterium]
MQTEGDPFSGQRNIWMLWLQGLEAAPVIVKACHRSWVARNPTWKVRFLSQETVGDYLPDEFKREVFSLGLPPQKVANLIRLQLISSQGGVWVDADCYCPQPLDDWLPKLMDGGFFAFRFGADAWLEENRNRPLARVFKRSSDRILSNWFLAGQAGNPVSGVFLEHHIALFRDGAFGTGQRRRGIFRVATALFRRNAYLAAKLSDPGILRAAKMFPYFVFHYHFARLTLKDASFHAAWRKVPILESENALQYAKSLHRPVDEQFLRNFAEPGSAPVFKLHWDWPGATIEGSRGRWLLDQGSVDIQ